MCSFYIILIITIQIPGDIREFFFDISGSLETPFYNFFYCNHVLK